MAGIDRTQEDINQDIRIANVEQENRSLKQQLAELSRKVDSHKAWTEGAVAPIVHIQDRVRSLEDIVKDVREGIENVKHRLFG